MREDTKHLLVLCTCPEKSVADTIAQSLVADRLAACVNIIPGLDSWFRWQGRIERAGELLLVIKTTRDRYPGVERKIRALHPYELPEIIALPLTLGHAPYLAWIEQATKPAP
jgi:periplasmic divalent cation tolerance protein